MWGTYSVDNHGVGGRGIMFSQRRIDKKCREERENKKKGGEEVFFSGGLWLVGEFVLFVPITGRDSSSIAERQGLGTW